MNVKTSLEMSKDISKPEQLITEHIDIWTSSILAKSTSGRGSSKKYELYGISKLRELILELAVRGKLVPQDDNDEPASVLLEKTAVEKAKLEEDGTIKKLKPVHKITNEEKPFNLPTGWKWARLSDISHYQVGKTPSTKNPSYWTESDKGIPWVSISDLNHFGTVKSTSKKITPLASESIFKAEPVRAGTILMSFKLTLGKISILEEDAYHNEAIISLYPFCGIFKEYLFTTLPKRALSGNSKQAIMGNTLNSKSLSLLLIPVPPLAEQKRIVAKVDELMMLCDQLEQQTEDSIDAHATLVEVLLAMLTDSVDADELAQNWARIAEHFDSLFTTEQSIEALKQTVLQLAVMGKLVPQNPDDEPASVLLEKIAEEKEQLIKDKVIKKEKPLPAITDDEKPFELQTGWVWVRLEDIVNIYSGITKGRKLAGKKLSAVPYLSVANVQRGYLLLDNVKTIEIPVEEVEKYEVLARDLLITEGGDWDKVGRTTIWNNELPYIAHQNHVFKARIFFEVQNEFWIETYLNSSFARDYFAGSSKQTTNLASINKTQLRGCLIALPPLSEQHRIVAKVDELMAICDQLKEKLQQSQKTQVQLTDALVDRALG